ncbi:MAG TPA: hypothetical protein VMX79_05780 [bacterium]|nr:hypothetical protein [bacterium]
MVARKGEVIGAGEIALVWSDATLARARRELPATPKVSFGWREYLGDEADVALGEDGLDYAVAYESYRLASDMTQRWYVAGGRAFLEWDGVPVGAAAQADLFSFFEPWLRLSAVLDHILATHRPAKVIFIDDGSPRSSFLAATLAARGVPYESPGGRRGARLGRRVGLAVRRLWPAMFLAARRKAYRGLQPGRLERRMTRPGAVVFWGQFGRFELDVYEEFRRAYGGDVPYVAATMAAARAAGRAGIICDTLLEGLPPLRRTGRLLRALSSDYAALERRGMFEEFGLAPGLAAFFREHFPFRPGAYLSTLASFATATERFLARWRPALVVHLSDVHMTGRLVAALAARDGVPALVVQNHITGGPTFGYLPLSSTKMAVWGQVSYDWMVEGGAPPEKLAVVGSPYAAVAARRSESIEVGEDERRAVVVATNNYDADVNRVLALAGAAYAKERGVPLVFRPHPAESEAPYRAVIRNKRLADAAVVRDAPLSEVLARAAVVVASHSGIGVDAVAAGVPLVHVNLLAGVPDYIPYVEYGAAVGVRDARDLPAALDDVLASPPGRFDAGREAFARAYLGSEAGDPFVNIAALARELEGSM